jgi:hypothetical protein
VLTAFADDSVYVISSDNEQGSTRATTSRPSPSKAASTTAQPTHDTDTISIASLELEMEMFEAQMESHKKKRHGFSSPPPTLNYPWAKVTQP